MSDAVVAAPAPEPVVSEAEPKGDSGGVKAPEPPKVPEPPRRHKVKVDAEEIEVDEDELKRGYAHAKAANKRFEEGAKFRKQAEDFVETLRADPLSILTNPKLGINFKDIAIKFLAEDIKKETNPEGWAKEQEDQTLRQKAKAYEDWQAKQAEDSRNAELNHLEQHYAKEYDIKLTEVLNGSGLPKTTGVVKRAAELMQIAVQKGYEPDLPAIIRHIREEYQGDIKALIGSLSGQEMIALFGEDTANKIRKADLARLRGPQPKAEASEDKPEAPRRNRNERPKRLNPREFLEAANKRAGF